ncbi:MAG TPA: DUF3606 domain-containing protein [Flavisolibacter sp.]|nr:DUF3606 domain-containing protein [Flavisolibacter sp.]
MADDKNARDNRDRNRVAASEDYEVQYLADELKTSKEEVRRAISRVGNDREKIVEFLRGSGRS